jgi:hypothetical protein
MPSDKDKSNAAVVLFLLAALNKGWLTVNHAATKPPYVTPNGWSAADIPGKFYKDADVQEILDIFASTGIVNGKSSTSTLNDDGTMGPGSMLDTLRAAWGVFHWLGTHPIGDKASAPYDPGSPECMGDISLVTGLHY